jgi:1-acyl-sn-glycerol-3-phosphate acyltransferase
LPLIARRAAALGKTEARALALDHAARARGRAGIEVVIEGADRIPRTGPFVLVYNEGSLVQDLANLEVLARFGVDWGVLAAEYGLIPFFKRAAPKWGVVLLRRGHRTEVERTLDELVAALRAGGRVSMAPQGRISPDGGVCHFKRGAFLIAIRAEVPVVPVGIRGGAAILRPGSLRMRPGVLRYRVGAPISVVGWSEAEAPELAEIARTEVERLVSFQDTEALPGSPSSAP